MEDGEETVGEFEKSFQFWTGQVFHEIQEIHKIIEKNVQYARSILTDSLSQIFGRMKWHINEM